MLAIDVNFFFLFFFCFLFFPFLQLFSLRCRFLTVWYLSPSINRQDTYRWCCLEIANVLMSSVQLEGEAVREVTSLLMAALSPGGPPSQNPLLGRRTSTSTATHWRGRKENDRARQFVHVDRYVNNTIEWMRKTIIREERTAAVGSARYKQIVGMKTIMKALPMRAANA